MRIDEYDLTKTAQAVFAMNPSVRAVKDSPESLMFFMVSMARQYLEKSTFFSTYGFCLSAYQNPDGETVVRASVSPSLVMGYLEDQEAMKNMIIGELQGLKDEMTPNQKETV